MEDRFYIDLDFKNKSDEIALRIGGRIIAEVPEMNGFQQRANSELKAFLSMSEDTYRVMYSQDQRTVTRRNMLIITENRRYILSDTTGNRRYAPIEVSKFDSEKIKDVVPLLWAEGAEIFKKYGGEKLHTDVEEITAERNDKYMIGDVWAETIAEYIENQSSLSDNERLPLTSGNIMRYGLKLDAGASSNPAICRRFNSVMETLGYARKVRRVKGKNAPVRDWVKIEE
jgi:predicted P-loop ATPase